MDKKNILDILFIKNTKLDRSLFNALYYSYESDSFLLSRIKRMEEWTRVFERHMSIWTGYF